MTTETGWVDALLKEENDVVEVKEVGLKIIHKGGGRKPVRRGTGTDIEKRQKELVWVNLEIALLADPKVDCKFQFYEGDDEAHDLVFEPDRWLAPVNHTYQIRVTKMGAEGRNVMTQVHRRDPNKVKMGMDAVVSAIQSDNNEALKKK